MKNFLKNFLIVLFFASALGCSGLNLDGLSTSATENSDTATVCASEDAACFQENLRLVGEDGEEIELVDVTGELPTASASSNAPAIVSVDVGTDSGDMELTSTDGVQMLWITFTDPLGSRPAFCMQTCPRNVRCVSSGMRCTRGFHDGLVSGTYKTWLGYRAEPADSATAESLTLSITPISAPDGSDPVEVFEDAVADGTEINDLGESSVVVGEAFEIDQTVAAEADDASDAEGDADEDSGDGTGLEGDACSSSSQCAGDCFSTRSCVQGLSCSCAGNASAGTCYNLSCSSAGGTCGDGFTACCVGLSCTNGRCVSSATSSCF